jgi:NitT/TauT family transport system substrate-binding protein
MFTRKYVLINLLAAASLLLAACTGATPTPRDQAAPVTVRFAMLPILDALPMFVAQSRGYFAEQNINLEVVPVASAAERDQLMQAGQADAMVNDLVSTMFYNRSTPSIVVVRFARTATPQFPQYFILAGPNSGISSPADLTGVEIAISEATVIDYITDRLLAAEGVAPADIRTVAIPRIGDRLAALADGTVKAAAMPDPAASAAMATGARVVLSDAAHPQYGNSVLSFSTDFVQQNPDAVRGFLAAWERAVADINANKTGWNELLRANNLLSEQLLGSYTLPDYPTGSVPSNAQFSDVNAWAKDNGLLTEDVSYEASVSAEFLP